jgi:hypothetical protein
MSATAHEDYSASFSLVQGGPLYTFYRCCRLLQPPFDLVERRVAAAVVVTWLPLLALALASGTAAGGSSVPFLADLDVHVRLLFALPLMIWVERLVHTRMSIMVGQFTERGIVPAHDASRASSTAPCGCATRRRSR